MMKKLLLFLTATMLSLGAWSASQVWFPNADAEGGWYAYGTKKIEQYSVAVFIPRDLMGGDNLKVGGLSINMGTPNFKNLKMWISTNLPDLGADGDVETKEVAKSLITHDTYCDVLFSQFHDVPESGLYVGYTFEVTSLSNYGNMPISFSGVINTREGSFFYNTTSTGKWLSDNEMKLMMNVLVECEVAENSVSPDDFATGYVVKGTGGNVPVKVTNTGGNAVNSIAYTVTTDGNVSEERVINLNLPYLMSSGLFNFVFDADEEPIAHEKLLTITKVNGQPNTSSYTTAKGTVVTVTHKPVYRPTIEEFTATWCGYCPYGIEGMKAAHEKYGDKVVLIAVHGSDVMAVEDYEPILAFADGFPSAILNREGVLYPDAYHILRLIDQNIDRVAVADIDTKATWETEEKAAINVKTKTSFVLNMDNAGFAIAYALLADGLKGTGSNWAQQNFLSGQSEEREEMQSWCNAPSVVTGMKFDHVAIGAWDIRYGISGSIASQVVAGEEQTFTYTLDISGKSLVQDKSKLSVVTLLIDRKTGRIMNAAQTAIGAPEDDPDGIISQERSVKREANVRYNLQGQRVDDAYKGIVVTKGRKVLVK